MNNKLRQRHAKSPGINNQIHHSVLRENHYTSKPKWYNLQSKHLDDHTESGTHQVKAELTFIMYNDNFLPWSLVLQTSLGAQRGCFWVFQHSWDTLCPDYFSWPHTVMNYSFETADMNQNFRTGIGLGD